METTSGCPCCPLDQSLKHSSMIFVVGIVCLLIGFIIVLYKGKKNLTNQEIETRKSRK